MSNAQASRAVRAMQIKELERRLRDVGHIARRRAEEKAKRPETPSIRQQRAAVQRFDDANYKREMAASSKAQKRVNDIRHVILFGDIDAAVKLVEKLEAEAHRA